MEIGDLAQILKDIMARKEEQSSIAETIMKDDRKNTLSHDRYQQKQGYQIPEKVPVCENNHNRPFLALMGPPVVRW